MATEAQKKRVKQWINKWRPRLFLSEWFIDVVYEKDAQKYMASADPDPVYLYCKLFLPTNFFKRPLKIQEEALVHELCHCITQEAYLLHIDSLNFKVVTQSHLEAVRERLTQRITNIAFKDEW